MRREWMARRSDCLSVPSLQVVPLSGYIAMLDQFQTDSLTVSAVSMNALLAEREKNLETIAAFTRLSVAAGAALVVTPECSACGHAPGVENKRAAEPLHGPTCEFLSDLCAELNCVVSAGIAEQGGHEWPYNTQILVGPEGLISYQRKLHLSGNENCFFQWGEGIRHAEIGRWRIGTIICFDSQFQELHRILALRGCELILAPHAARCGMPDADLTRARDSQFSSAARLHGTFSQSNACYEVYVNQVGVSGKGSARQNEGWGVHAGGIAFTGPKGNVLARHNKERAEPEFVVCTLDRKEVCEMRRTFRTPIGFRRCDLFGELVSPQVQRTFRERYGRPAALPDWQAEEMEPRWQVDYPR